MARLLADDGARGDNFGGARWFDTYADPVEPVYYATPGESALSSEGTVAVVGAPGASAGGRAGAGAAYVFADRGGSWRQGAKLVASDGAAYDALGWTVAISGAGDEVLVGAPFADIAGQEDQGAAYVFSERSGRWSQTQKIVEPGLGGLRRVRLVGGDRTATGAARVDRRTGPARRARRGSAGAAYLYRRGDAATAWTDAHPPRRPSPERGRASSARRSTCPPTGRWSPSRRRRTATATACSTWVRRRSSARPTVDTPCARSLRFDDPSRNTAVRDRRVRRGRGRGRPGTVIAVAAPDVNVDGVVAAGAAHVYGTTCGWERPACTTDRAAHRAGAPSRTSTSDRPVALSADGTSLLIGNDGAGSNGQGEGELLVARRGRPTADGAAASFGVPGARPASGGGSGLRWRSRPRAPPGSPPHRGSASRTTTVRARRTSCASPSARAPP